MKVRNPFVFPRTNQGARRLEYGIIAAGIAIAILAVWLQVATRQPESEPDRLGLLIELMK